MIIIMIVSLDLITDLVFWLWLLTMSLLIMAWIVMNMHNKLIKEQSYELINTLKEGNTSATREFLEHRQNLLASNNGQYNEDSLPDVERMRIASLRTGQLSVIKEEDGTHVSVDRSGESFNFKQNSMPYQKLVLSAGDNSQGSLKDHNSLELYKQVEPRRVTMDKPPP